MEINKNSFVDKFEKYFGFIFIIIGLLFIVCNFFSQKSYKEKKEKYIAFEATIIEHAITTNDNGEKLRAEIVEYEVNGKTYIKQNDMYSSNSKAVGEKILIYYNPNNPEEVIFERNILMNNIFTIVGGIFSLVGVIFVAVFFLPKKKQNNEPKELTPKQILIIGFVFGILGIIFIVTNFYLNYKYNEKSNSYIETEANVVDYAYKKNNKNEKLTAVIIEYEVDGKIYSRQDNTYTSNPKAIGSTILIKYNPDNPNDILFEKTILNYVLFFIGGMFISVGTTTSIVLYIFSKNEKKSEA